MLLAPPSDIGCGNINELSAPNLVIKVVGGTPRCPFSIALVLAFTSPCMSVFTKLRKLSTSLVNAVISAPAHLYSG